MMRLSSRWKHEVGPGFQPVQETASSSPIPTGLRQSAQGCEARATLGKAGQIPSTLKGLKPARPQRCNPVGVEDPLLMSPRVGAGCANPGLNVAIPLGLAEVRAVHQDLHPSSLWISVLIMVLLGAAGCSTPPKTSFRPASTPFPAEALVTQRGVLTVLGRQFTLNGYLALSPTGGKRLVVTENFGSVLADVLITPDGVAHVMRSSRALKPKWIRRYLAADVQCLTGGTTVEECPGGMISPTHYLVQRRWYKLDLQTVNVKPGPQPATMFDASRAEKP